MIAIIGAGVSGSLIARELIQYKGDVALFEQNVGPGRAITKANSGIIHGGYDDPPGSWRAKFCYHGNRLYEKLSAELAFRLDRCGSHVVAFSEEELFYLDRLGEKALKNGVREFEILGQKELRAKEPRISKEALGSFYCPIAGVTNPWMVAHQAVRNFEANGGQLHFRKKIVSVEETQFGYRLHCKDGSFYEADIVINAAGLFSYEVAKMFGDVVPAVYPIRGEYLVVKPELKYVNAIIFPVPNEVSKGCLVVPVIDGGFLIGPNAERVRDKDDSSNTLRGLQEIKAKGLKLVPQLDYRREITKTFAGLRPESPGKDFHIAKGSGSVIHVSGIRSPGLTAAPAISRYVVQEILKKEMGVPLRLKEEFRSYVDGFRVFNERDSDRWSKRIADDPEAGDLVCFCNTVSRKEIREAIAKGARSIEDIKFLTGATFGECQGNYCFAEIVRFLAEDLQRSPQDVLMNEPGSWIIASKVRS